METKELKTIGDYQEAFAKLTSDCRQKFGAEKISVYITDDVEITFK
jgi:hypothetical protein